MKNRDFFYGSKEICEYVRENYKKMNYLVRNEDLPAYRKVEHGTWRALRSDLDDWLISQRDKHSVRKLSPTQLPQ